MDQRSAQQSVRHVLGEYGFQTVHETTAVILLEHPAYPGVTVRMGTTRIMAERNSQECYRSRISEFHLDDLIACIADQVDPDESPMTDRA